MHDIIPNYQKLGAAFPILLLQAPNYLPFREELVSCSVAIWLSAVLTAAISGALLFPSEPRNQVAAGRVEDYDIVRVAAQLVHEVETARQTATPVLEYA
jgi:hypothetical protein